MNRRAGYAGRLFHVFAPEVVLIDGRIHPRQYRRVAAGQPGHLGFEFRWITTRNGGDSVKLRTDSKRLRRIVREFKDWCMNHRHKRMEWIMGMVKAKLRGLRNYYGVVGNSAFVSEVNLLFRQTLYRWLNRRSERKSYAWPVFSRIWTMYNVSSLRRLDNEGFQLSFLPFLK